MSGTIPVLSIIFMVVSMIISFAIPVGLFIYFFRKKHADILPFFIGCGVMFVFALIIESIFHQIILGSSVGDTILDNTWLYALYGGFMAGLFEETGRFVAFKTVLKKYTGKDINALMYGAGHGGFEAVALVGFSMISNIITSVMINSGMFEMITATLSGDQLEQLEAGVEDLITLPSYMFLVGSIERVSAVIIQLSLSVLVWFAAKNNNRLYLYPVAILLHLIVDGITVILMRNDVSLVIVEIAIFVMAVLIAFVSKKIWDKESVIIESKEEV